ncbi:MAG: hypothetical protein A2V99_04170 [Spirochaetes bacterium RBG_16_67_19]|nr:MAG: hypothetical protein A2V99_04170 [Spirochaetes bacterium RBG_16_67_19]
MSAIEPVLVALLFADRVLVEEGNHKKTIVGTFTQFYSEKFPVVFPPWFIYAAATNFAGEFSFSVNLVLEKDQQVVLGISGKVKADNRNKVNEFIFPIQRAIFPSAGTYSLTFNIGGVQVGSRLLEVIPQPQNSMS